MFASPILMMLLLAAPQLEVPAGKAIQLDGVVQAEEWSDATEIRSGTHFVRLKRQGRWLAVAFGGEGRYAGEELRLFVSDESGAWQTALLMTGGLPTLPPALWARAHPGVIYTMLRDNRAPLLAPRGALARMNVGEPASWSGEYLVRLGVLGLGRGDLRKFRCRIVIAPRRRGSPPALVYPESTTDRTALGEHALLVSPDGWGANETWEVLDQSDSVLFDDHQLLWRLAVENDRFNIRGEEGQIVIAQTVRPRSEANIEKLRRRIEAGMQRNPTLPAWTHFLGRLLHEANRYEAAAKVIDSIPKPLRRLDAFALLAAEHYLDTQDWEQALLIASAYPEASGMRELASAANKLRNIMQAEEEVEKEAVMRAEPLPVVRITTRKGVIEAELFEDEAPHAVVNFVNLVEEKYYDGMRFTPVIGSAIARSGDPRTRDGRRDGPDGPPWKVKQDRSPRQPLFGRLVALAADGGVNHGSQFGILLAPVTSGGGDVIVFGRVTKGLDVLQTIEDGDVITKVEVVEKRNHSYGALASRVK